MKLPLFTVVYEDPRIIAVNKAAGITVSGDRWDETQVRLDQIVAESMPASARLFRVHRIDRDTSGLVLFAKDSGTHRLFAEIFENRQIYKRYIAIVNGRPMWKEEECALPLIPDGNKKHMTIVDKYRGKKSLTRFRVLDSAGTFSVLEALPETGRTHQIRVHAAALGFPVVCDSLYGSSKPVMLSSFKRNWRGDPLEEKPLLARLGLHAAELVIPGGMPPQTGDSPGDLRLLAPLARDMTALISQMEKAH
jgi:RluA family pseudouridine synthase